MSKSVMLLVCTAIREEYSRPLVLIEALSEAVIKFICWTPMDYWLCQDSWRGMAIVEDAPLYMR
eukprot:1007728-Amphidinium_carterae.1